MCVPKRKYTDTDHLNFPIFQFKANPAKPVDVKPKRIRKVKADKGKSGTDDIQKYFIIPGKSANTNKSRPTEQATQLSQSLSEQPNK